MIYCPVPFQNPVIQPYSYLFCVCLLSVMLNDLWCDVAGCACVALGAGGDDCPADAVVGQADLHGVRERPMLVRLRERPHQDVLCLQISIDDQVRVKIFHGRGNLENIKISELLLLLLLLPFFSFVFLLSFLFLIYFLYYDPIGF